MSELSNLGYQPLTPQELRELLEKQVIDRVPDFQNRPADLQNNLLNESVPILMRVEFLVERLFNGYSPSFANNQFLEFQGANFGLPKKGYYDSVVDLKFTGSSGTLIPKGLRITNTEESVVFETIEEYFIGTTGTLTTFAVTNQKDFAEVGVGTLTKIQQNIKGLSVTNIDTPTKPVDSETYEAYRDRIQQRFRNPKVGSYGAIINAVRSVEGVVDRTIAYKLKEIMESGKTYEAIEVLVDGGDPLEIAKALYLHGGILPKKFLSEPSASETNRTITQNLIINQNVHTYKFTRPKNINISIKVTLSLLEIQTTNNALQETLKGVMQEFINTLEVGVRPNIQALTQQVIIGLGKALKRPALNINQKEIGFEVKNMDSGSSVINFTSQGFLDIQFDNYLTLTEFLVQLNG